MNKTDELCELFGAARDWIAGDPFELYQRHASTLTVRLGERGTRQVDRGEESGSALRVRRPSPNGLVFAAGSGSDATAIRSLIEDSKADYGELIDTPPWPENDESLEDLAPAIELPTESQATEWLREAVEHLESQASPAQVRCDRARLEIAATVESWAATPGRRMTRTRCRAFALATLRSDRSDLNLLPVRVAARHWTVLSPRSWSAILADRSMGRLEPASSREHDLPLLFNPETAARLARGFVERGIVPAASAGSWREDAKRSGALLGGSFDDAGFPAQPRKLTSADDLQPAFRSRPSFRDRPEPRYADLWIDAAEVPLPRRAALVVSARLIDADGNRLQLERDGVTLEAGRPGKRFRGAWVSAERSAWGAACRGGVGPVRSDSSGVTTPALRFDGLRLRI